MPQTYSSSDATNAMVARVAPAVLELLADGVPRTKRAIVAALADRHPKHEVVLSWRASPWAPASPTKPILPGTSGDISRQRRDDSDRIGKCLADLAVQERSRRSNLAVPLSLSQGCRRRVGSDRSRDMNKNTICLWYDKDAEEAARFYAQTFPDSEVGAIQRAPSDYPAGKAGDVLTVEFKVCGVPCIGLNGGPAFQHNEAFSFQIATDDQAETDRYWNAIVGNGGAERQCGWCKDKWGVSWQITPRVLTDALAQGGDVAKRAFDAMMTMGKIDVVRIEAAVKGERVPG
jgi:predicted 3-demethylubiquinone-9 3-methyltransferase (glyoxalase superfamily)